MKALTGHTGVKLYIKNMVSIRCKMTVREELKKLGIHCLFVDLGEAEIAEILTVKQRDLVKHALLKSGLELMDDHKSILIERIKNVIVELIHYSDDEQLSTNFSDYLSEKLKFDYTYLANLFSETEGTTIERHLINHRIERVKELLVYDELTLTEIAHKLNYSSVAHLSNQFKKMTGLTPSFFKKIKKERRKVLESL
jgi:AraC-like DNA-binding protein